MMERAFNLEEIQKFLEFFAFHCDTEDNACDETCPQHELCTNLSAEDISRIARDTIELIEALNVQIATQNRIADVYIDNWERWRRIAEDLNVALRESQARVEELEEMLSLIEEKGGAAEVKEDA